MRHSIGGFTGFGNPNPVRLCNNGKLKDKEFWDKFLEDCQENFRTIANYSGFDFFFVEKGFAFGIEPSYKYDDLQIIYIDYTDKNECYIEQGRAFGYYGTQCVTKIKKYGDYQRKCKFVKFIDKWYEQLIKQCKKEKEYDR